MRNIITILFLAVSAASALAQARIINTTATRPVTEAPAISAYRANALTFRVKLDATRPTLTGVTTLTAEIRASKLDTGAPLAATDIDAPTEAGPFDIEMTAGQMNQSLNGAASGVFWLVIYTIAPNDVLDVLYTAPLKLMEHGASLTAPSPPNTAIALTRSAADALYTTLAATAALDVRVTDLEAGTGTDTVLGDSDGVGVSDSSDLWVSDGTPAGAVDLTPYALTATIAAGYQPLDSDLTSLAALASTTFGRGLITTVDAAGLRTSAGLGTLATQSGTFSGTSSGTNTGDQDLSGYLASATAATTYVPVTRTINGSALSSDVTISTITGNAGTATALATPRAINGTNFDGSAAITVTAAAATLTGNTLNAAVTASSLTSAAGGAFGTGAYAATPTRATLGLATSDSPAFAALSLAGQSLTGTQATSLAEIATTWNTTGIPTAFKLDVTNTASNAASSLMDLRSGGISRFRVQVDGQVYGSVASFASYALIPAIFARSATGRFVMGAADDVALQRNAAGVAEINSGTTNAYRDLRVRSIIAQPPATITPASNGDMVFEATSNTSVTLKLKGTDGTVRSVVLTLAP